MSHYHDDNVEEMEDEYEMNEAVDDMEEEEEYHEPVVRDSDAEEEDDEDQLLYRRFQTLPSSIFAPGFSRKKQESTCRMPPLMSASCTVCLRRASAVVNQDPCAAAFPSRFLEPPLFPLTSRAPPPSPPRFCGPPSPPLLSISSAGKDNRGGGQETASYSSFAAPPLARSRSDY